MPDQKASSSDSGSKYLVSPWCCSAGKRFFDVFAATFLSIVLLPVMIGVAIGVKCTSPGPVFFRQRRPGENRSEFFIIKFRTMVDGKQGIGPVLTKSADPRITWFGHYLRKWKLDELPQLFNVLAGHMSFVGPRPQPTKLWDEPSIQKEAACVLSVRPGLTSKATLSFRNEEELLEELVRLSPDDTETLYMKHIMPLKLGMDLEYLRTATLREDLGLICKTIFRIFRRQIPQDDSLRKECVTAMQRGKSSSSLEVRNL